MRRLMSDDVLRASRSSHTHPSSLHPPAPTTRPHRSNLATRLQSGMNLQICFMNDGADEDTQSGLVVPKSKSTPDLGVSVTRSQDDSCKRASELSAMAAAQFHTSDPALRDALFQQELKVMFAKAAQAAHLQLEVDKTTCRRPERSPIEDVVGFPLSRRRLNRTQLSKMNCTALQIIVNELHSKIEALNEDLVKYLIEKDSLHMEQDSMLVDIEDLLQHKRSTDVKIPEFLVVQAVQVNSTESLSRRFRIFKK